MTKFRLFSDTHYYHNKYHNEQYTHEVFSQLNDGFDGVNLIAGDVGASAEEVKDFCDTFLPKQRCIIIGGNHFMYGYHKTYSAINEHYKKIITVTGAAGGREKEKRSKIGEVVLAQSDVVIFTMDDPRYEDVDEIINDLAGNTTKEYFRIKDRRDAIYFALNIANSNSVVLILGKGRDNYMAIEDKKVPYCDYDVIKDFYNM